MNKKEQIGSKSKTKDRLFGSSKKICATVQQKQEQEIDVFELIAQKVSLMN